MTLFTKPVSIPNKDKIDLASELIEQRSTRRRRVLKTGNIHFNKGYNAYSCRVKNITDDGVMVEMEDSSGLPGRFDFIIGGEDKTREATVCWRTQGKAGIRFL